MRIKSEVSVYTSAIVPNDQSVRENVSKRPETRHETRSTIGLRGELSLRVCAGTDAFLPFRRSAFFWDLLVGLVSPAFAITSNTNNAITAHASAAKNADAKLTLTATLPIGTKVAR